MTSRIAIRGLQAAALAAAAALALGTPLEASAGQVDRTVTRTGPGGKTRTWQHHRQVTREPGHRTRTSTHVGPNGKTLDTTAETTRTENGFERTVTRTGPEGGSRTWTSQVERNENGFTRTITREDGEGNQGTKVIQVERDPEAGTLSRSIEATLADGSTRSSSTDVVRTDEGFDRTSTRVGRDGTTQQIDVEVARDPETGEVTRSVTRSTTPPADDGSTQGTPE